MFFLQRVKDINYNWFPQFFQSTPREEINESWTSRSLISRFSPQQMLPWYYYIIIILNYYYIIYVCSLTANHSNGHPLSISSNRNLSYAITVKSKGGIYHTINCTAIINIINLLKVQFPGICYLSLEPKLVLHHWIQKSVI